MLAKRIIPCLDVKDGRVVKGTNFQGLRDMADPVEMARFYNESGADELVFYDITASAEGRNLFTDILRRVAGEIFIPLTVGGGIRTLEDFDRVLKCGADKVSVNSGAIADPSLIGAAAKKYGDQCVVLSMDVKRVDGQFRLFAKGGREDTGIDAMEWAARGVADGAGRRRFSSPLMVEVLAARRDGDAEDFHIARASPSIRAVSRMDVLLPAIIGQRARRRMRYPHSAKEDLCRISRSYRLSNSAYFFLFSLFKTCDRVYKAKC